MNNENTGIRQSAIVIAFGAGFLTGIPIGHVFLTGPIQTLGMAVGLSLLVGVGMIGSLRQGDSTRNTECVEQ